MHDIYKPVDGMIDDILVAYMEWTIAEYDVSSTCAVR